MKLAKWVTDDLTFTKESFNEFVGNIPLGILTAVLAGIIIAAGWLG